MKDSSRPSYGRIFAPLGHGKKFLNKTEYARKLDSNGRLVIPAKLRDKLELQEGNIYDFFIHEQDGKTFLCIECPVKGELEKAFELLESQGYSIQGYPFPLQ